MSTDPGKFRFVVVGAGFYGAVTAERIASVLGEPVLVIDRKSHIGGNSWSSIDEATGIEIHRYGSHIFHTANAEVWNYINRFGSFTSYRHKVLITCGERVFFMPINLKTINEFYGRNLSPEEVPALIAREAGSIGNPANLEEKAISLIGRPLYETFIKGYTAKQWGCDPKELPASIITRLPVRSNYNTDYFNDPWQGVPLEGYGRLFERMLEHPLITVQLNTDFRAVKEKLSPECRVVYTGMLDELYDSRFGALEWRTLRFETETRPVRDFQGTTVMNYGEESVPFTRIHEYKHYHPERQEVFESGKTVICREYPKNYEAGDEAYYPVNSERNQELYRRYRELADATPGLRVGGRLGAYQYWDMDKAIGHALADFEKNFPTKK